MVIRDLVKYTEEINSNVVDSRLMILWSGEQKELLKRMMDDSEIHFSSYLHQPGAKFTDSLYSYKEFLDCLESTSIMLMIMCSVV